jgi:hypothetical protein
MARVALLLVTLSVASLAHAAWYPVFERVYIQVRPGETVSVPVQGAWLSGIHWYPFHPMSFAIDDPTIAAVQGSLMTTAKTTVQVTGLRPGVTRAHITGAAGGYRLSTLPVIAVAEEELPIAIGINGVLRTGNTLTLEVISDEPDATFTWFQGSMAGPYTWEVGSGRVWTVELTFSAIYEYWVLVTSPRGAGATGVSLHVEQSRRRRAAHH